MIHKATLAQQQIKRVNAKSRGERFISFSILRNVFMVPLKEKYSSRCLVAVNVTWKHDVTALVALCIWMRPGRTIEPFFGYFYKMKKALLAKV